MLPFGTREVSLAEFPPQRRWPAIHTVSLLELNYSLYKVCGGSLSRGEFGKLEIWFKERKYVEAVRILG